MNPKISNSPALPFGSTPSHIVVFSVHLLTWTRPPMARGAASICTCTSVPVSSLCVLLLLHSTTNSRPVWCPVKWVNQCHSHRRLPGTLKEKHTQLSQLREGAKSHQGFFRPRIGVFSLKCQRRDGICSRSARVPNALPLVLWWIQPPSL